MYNFVVTVNGTEFFRQDGNNGTQSFECVINKDEYETGEVEFYLETQNNIDYSANIRQRLNKIIPPYNYGGIQYTSK